MMPIFHPAEEVLFEYATGAAHEAHALLVATHLALCPLCREEVARFEAIGGVLLDEIAPATLAAGALDAALARLDGPAARQETARVAPPAPERGANPLLPRPLRDYLPAPLEALPWKRYGGSLEAFDLALGRPGIKARLLRIKAGRAMLAHTHSGLEQTLVLTGGFSDSAGHYGRGDVAVADETVKHRPVADTGEDCLCLVVVDAPPRLIGPLGRLLNPFIKF